LPALHRLEHRGWIEAERAVSELGRPWCSCRRRSWRSSPSTRGLAGPDPAWVSGSSNFDWGQGAVALERYFTDRPVPELYILLSGTVRACRMKLPSLKSLPDHPVTGWIAISDGPHRANGGLVREDPCGVADSPGPRRRATEPAPSTAR